MAQTIIGTKRQFINFIEKNISNDSMVVITDGFLEAATHKHGNRIKFQYASETFAHDDKGISPLLGGKNIAIWIGSPDSLSASSKKMLTNAKKKKRVKA